MNNKLQELSDCTFVAQFWIKVNFAQLSFLKFLFIKKSKKIIKTEEVGSAQEMR